MTPQEENIRVALSIFDGARQKAETAGRCVEARHYKYVIATLREAAGCEIETVARWFARAAANGNVSRQVGCRIALICLCNPRYDSDHTGDWQAAESGYH